MMLMTLATLLVQAGNADADFAARLHGQISKNSGNLFYSPSSIRLALAMVHAGAKGETALELEKLLGLPANAPQYFKGMLADWNDLANPALQQTSTNDPGLQKWYEEQLERRRLTLRIANRLWGAKGYKFEPSYLAMLRDSYNAPLEQLDFAGAPEPSREIINASVAKATDDKIKDLVPSGMIQDATKLVITNAIYFKAQWSNPFEKLMTKKGPFKRTGAAPVDVSMMHQVDHFKLAETADVQVLELPYANGEMAMDVILPRAGLPAVEKAFAGGALAKWIGAMESRKVDVTLPLFKMQYKDDLAKTLEAMGIKTLFSYGKADLSGMDGSKQLFVSKIVHQAYVNVNEEGTEAAAATAVGMEAGGVPMKEKIFPFKADHPFIFVIRDTRSSEVLFVGRVSDPS